MEKATGDAIWIFTNFLNLEFHDSFEKSVIVRFKSNSFLRGIIDRNVTTFTLTT